MTTLTIQLSDATADRLRTDAALRGESAETAAASLLNGILGLNAADLEGASPGVAEDTPAVEAERTLSLEEYVTGFTHSSRT